MSSEPMMTQDGALAHVAGSLISGGAFTVVSVPSLKTKAVGSGVYRGPLLYTFAGGDADGFVPGSVVTPAPQTIAATAIKTKLDGLAVIRLGDSGTMVAIGTIPPPTGGTAPVSGSVEVSDAGQDKAQAQ